MPLSIAAGFLLMAMMLLGCEASGSRARPCVHFSGERTGWHAIRYGVTGAPELRHRDHCLEVDFRGEQLIETKTAYQAGWASDSYEEHFGGQLHQLQRDSVGRGVQARHTKFNHTQAGTVTTEWFFLGTREELRSSPTP